MTVAETSPHPFAGGSTVRVAAWGALALGVLYAAVSAYWALGGTAGLDILGGRLAELARSPDPLALVGIWLVVALKIVAAALGVMMLRTPPGPWRRLLLIGTWVAACVLVLYGGFLVAGHILVVTGFIEAVNPDWAAIYGHLFLWDPWFLLWGLLLLVVAITASRAVPRSP